MSKSLYQTQIENRAPTSSDTAVIGNWWIDTSASPNALYLYKASGWELQGGSSGGGVQKYIMNSTPRADIYTDVNALITNGHTILYGEFTFPSITVTRHKLEIDTANNYTISEPTATTASITSLYGSFSNGKYGNFAFTYYQGDGTIEILHFQSNTAYFRESNLTKYTSNKFVIGSGDSSVTINNCSGTIYYI